MQRTASRHSAGVMSALKGPVQAGRQMDMSRTTEKRQHAEGEAHNEAEEINISPGHGTPRAHFVRELEFETQALLVATPTLVGVDATQLRREADGGLSVPCFPPFG